LPTCRKVVRHFDQQGHRIDKLAAISGAYAEQRQHGRQGGEQTLAVGYRRAIGNRASVSIGGAFSIDEKSVSAGAGFS
jgi:trimeric autotransporter adhesin